MAHSTPSSDVSNQQNFIVSFYDPNSTATNGSRHQDGKGRTLDNILSFSDNELEYHHDYIQYLFPLPERSPVNPSAPLITADVRSAFLSRPELRQELHRAFSRMLNFYGFEATSGTSTPADTGAGEGNGNGTRIVKLTPDSRFRSNATRTWLKRLDHNHLRITRILRCLRILGLEAEAKEFLRVLRESDDVGAVVQRSWAYWGKACDRLLYLAPDVADDADGVDWLKE